MTGCGKWSFLCPRGLFKIKNPEQWRGRMRLHRAVWLCWDAAEMELLPFTLKITCCVNQGSIHAAALLTLHSCCSCPCSALGFDKKWRIKDKCYGSVWDCCFVASALGPIQLASVVFLPEMGNGGNWLYSLGARGSMRGTSWSRGCSNAVLIFVFILIMIFIFVQAVMWVPPLHVRCLFLAVQNGKRAHDPCSHWEFFYLGALRIM